jgi:hypothetical protein
MKKLGFILLAFLCSCGTISDNVIFNNGSVQEPAKKEAVKKEIVKKVTPEGEILIDDFSKRNMDALKGNVNPWAFNPKDPEQGCMIKYNKTVRMGDEGASLQIFYDVDSPSQAFNGVYWELKDADLSSCTGLTFYVKGDPEKGFTATFKIELKNNNSQTGVYYVQGVTQEWQKFTVPFSDFKGLTDLTSMKEFTIVFVDSEVTKKEGVLFIDDLKAVK